MKARVLLILAAVAVVCVSSACGKKGPPLAPLRPIPQLIPDLLARRFGDEVRLRFTVPSTNTDGTSPADVARVEVYALTGNPTTPTGQPLEPRDFMRYGTLVGRIEVQPPPPPDQGEDAPKEGEPPPPPPPPKPPDPRPAQGEVVHVIERLGPQARVPFVHPDVAKLRPPVAAPVPVVWGTRLSPPLAWPPADQRLSRVYVAVAISRHNNPGPLSARIAVPIDGVPPAPPTPGISNNDTAIGLTWTEPPGARKLIQAPAVPPVLGARLLFSGPPSHTYNVYDAKRPADSPDALVPINPVPWPVPQWVELMTAFGVEKCYTVRTVEVVGPAWIESEPSPPACLTPVDTFPPAAPTNLAAVGSEGAVSLIWEANTEADLAGYLVLRGDAPGGDLTPLTPAPIRETTYRDTTAQPGVRYVYAIVAVDNAPTPNQSPPSNTVEESAR